jgi:hypothetical protein
LESKLIEATLSKGRVKALRPTNNMQKRAKYSEFFFEELRKGEE